MSIQDMKGRKGDITGSGYYRLLQSQKDDDKNDGIAKDIARLLSKIHSASISNGAKLESEYIGNETYNKNCPKKEVCITDLVSLSNGHYINIKFDKKLWNDNEETENQPKKTETTEVDYITFEKDTEKDTGKETVKVKLFEIKDGDTFDTKKSRSELQSLEKVKKLLQDTYTNAEVTTYVVLWNTKDLSENGFKAKLIDTMLITGKMMCELIGNLDYEKINHDRKCIGNKNLQYILSSMKRILYVYDNDKKFSEIGVCTDPDETDEITDTTVDDLAAALKTTTI